MRNNLFEHIRAEWRLFSLAGSFLSRFFPAARAESREIAASVRYYPLLGLLLGLAGLCLIKAVGALGLPPQAGVGAAGFAGLGVGAAPPAPESVVAVLFTAFIYVLWLAFATRGLHWDGWADLGDACGAASCGAEKFMAALKDSRIGAFGVLALAFGISGQILLAAGVIAGGYFWALAWAPMFGRQLAIVLAHCSWRGFCALPRPGSLGELCVRGAGPRALGVTLFFTCLPGLFLPSPKTLPLAALLAAGLIYALARISRSSGVFNGDFLGAAIIGGELCAFLAIWAA